MDIKERLEDFEKRLAALERGQGRNEPPVIETDLTLPEACIGGLHFNETKVHAVFEKQDDGWYHSRDILFLSARNVKDDNKYDTLAEYLNCYDFKNSIRRQLPEEIFGEVMAPDQIEVSLPKENAGIKKYNGAGCWYWLADSYAGSADYFCNVNNYGYINYSGTKTPDKRKLGGLLDSVREGDLIICAELSRLGRSLFMIMSILNGLMKIGAKVWTIKDNYRLGDDIQSKVLAFAFGLSAEIERDLISQRTKEALALRRAEGVVLGRPAGKKSSCVKLTGKEKEIKKLRKQGIGKSELGRVFGVNRMTVDRFMKDNGIA